MEYASLVDEVGHGDRVVLVSDDRHHPSSSLFEVEQSCEHLGAALSKCSTSASWANSFTNALFSAYCAKREQF